MPNPAEGGGAKGKLEGKKRGLSKQQGGTTHRETCLEKHYDNISSTAVSHVGAGVFQLL